ncbi:hypothetical protein A1O1_06134 [Capronia coronata CBS 617.96]|uniref:Uncharacterized protein n=1 Tax=Capronia coronata CBS 617.96 TaxID=1182541 RepID=W9Y936_9EURO|nr:uncharacterized protein A1O1_06134 [Capronia coronata CBS 617.96]EXJ85766.1 hypothetical protein A1O1_06134 [Capronia coronata CBS 617.96]
MANTKTDFSTPDIPMSEAVFYVSACTRINAPASLVFRTLRNTETWRDWNRWVPRVTITFQPEEEDDATLAEIEELVRNTSIAVSFDSDITDGAARSSSPGPKRGSRAQGSTGGNPSPLGTGGDSRRKSSEGFSLPPVTRQRLASNASRFSERPSGETPRSNSTNGQSAAQKYAAAYEARKASIASGEQPAPAKNAVLLESPAHPSILMPAPANTPSTALAVSNKASRRKSGTSSSLRRQLHINALYGEPSVRIQVGTRMTLHMRMKLPHSHESREQHVVVTEVSRPDDPLDDADPESLMRAPTHTASKSGVYRLVWSMVNSYNPPKAYPKFMLQTQRVHEIRPIISGDGTETCEYWDWEAQKGILAKKNKREQAKYMEERMAEWGTRLGEFCESMGGAVERRDFVSG